MFPKTATLTALEAVRKSQNWERINLIGEFCLVGSLLIILHNKNSDEDYVGLPEDGVLLHARMINFKKNYQNELRKVIRKKQWDIICPRSGISNSADWDITIIKVVIQYEVLHSLPPLKGWENDVDPTDFSIAADVIRIKDIRNQLKHKNVKAFENDTYYRDTLTEIEKILIRLGYDNMALYNELQHCFLDKYTIDIKRILEDMVSDTNFRYDNMVDDMNEELNRISNNNIAIVKSSIKEEVRLNKSNIDSEIEHIKKILLDVTNTTKTIDSDFREMLEDEIEELKEKIERKYKFLEDKVNEHELSIQELQAEVKGLSPEPKQFILPICMELIKQGLGNEWKRSATFLRLPREDTSRPAKASWKNIELWLRYWKKFSLIQRLKNGTNLTCGLDSFVVGLRSYMKDCYKRKCTNGLSVKLCSDSSSSNCQKEVLVDLSDPNEMLTQLFHLDDKSLLITGEEKLGKSHLIDIITLKWAREEVLNGMNSMPNIQVLFPIDCSEINKLDLQTNDHFDTILPKLFPNVFNDITISDLQDIDHKIMFIVDNLDKLASIDQFNEPHNISNWEVQKIVYFVRKALGLDVDSRFPNQYTVAVGRPSISSILSFNRPVKDFHVRK